MNDALNIIPAKVRAGIYALLIIANAVVTPLMAAGEVPSLYGALTLSLLGVFGGTLALSNVNRSVPAAAASVAAPVETPAPLA